MRPPRRAPPALGLALGFAFGLAPACGEPPPPTPSGDGVPRTPALPPANAPDSTAPPAPQPGPPPLAPVAERSIYLVLTDRFANGDPSNDVAGATDCFDPKAPKLFHGGDLAGLRQRIPYLAELGVGTVWITPVAKQEPRRGNACGFHGYYADYAAPDDGAIEPKLGTLAELRALRDDLHARGMRLVLDLVVNHAGPAARIVRQHPEWFHDPSTCAQQGPAEVTCPLGILPDFAQEKPEVAEYLTAMSVGWFDRAQADGVRMDTAKHVPASYFATSWVPAIRKRAPDALLVAEIFDWSWAKYRTLFDAGFDAAFDFPLHGALVEAFAKGGSVDEISRVVHEAIAQLGVARARSLVTMLDNHDLPRFLHAAEMGASDEERARRHALGLVALYTLPGIPQLYYGDEIAALGGPDPDNRRDMPAWAFDPQARAGVHAGFVGDGARAIDLTKRLAALRVAEPALSRGGWAELWRQGTTATNVLAFHRAEGASRVAVVLPNMAQDADLSLPFETNPGITAADRAAWPEGTVLEEVLGAGASPTAKIVGGRIAVRTLGKAPGVYRAKRASP
jgi:glycosidase